MESKRALLNTHFATIQPLAAAIDSDIQVIVLSVVGFTVLGSYSEIPNNCFFDQLSFFKYITDVLRYSKSTFIK